MVSPFFGVGPTPVDKDSKERSKEFENTIGNLLVAEYQVHRLRERVKNTLNSALGTDKQVSEFMFRIEDNWYRIRVSAEKQEEIQEKKEPEPEPNPKPVKHHKKSKGVFDPDSMDAAVGAGAWCPDLEEESVGVP